MPRALIAALAGFLAIGCGTAPSPDLPTAAPAQQPIQAEAADGEFRLVLKADGARHAAGAAIAMTTELQYLGPRPQVQLAGSGGGLVVVSLTQLDGPLQIAGGGSDDCVKYTIAPGAPMVKPYVKNGGWDEDGPNAAFYRAFFADPLLRLPRGTWRVIAMTEFSVGDCPGPSHKLDAILELVVE